MIEKDYFSQPFVFGREVKQDFLMPRLRELIEKHCDFCSEYKNILNIIYPEFIKKCPTVLEDVPFLPVPLFKEMDLKSIKKEEIFKTLFSSGTSSQRPSKIFLDRKTAELQSRVLISIVNDFIGANRRPMIIVDKLSTVQDRTVFNARAAGILGFSGFGIDHLYLLDGELEIKINELCEFLEKHKGKEILVFGFTFMLWKYFYKACLDKKLSVNLNRGIVIHGGGWKKLKDEAVSEKEFKRKLIERFNLRAIHNYYGFIEQVGSIFMECECGHLHTSVFSDVLIRDQYSLKPLPFCKVGLIQGLSVLPYSYPGHSILTEDLGECLGEDDCSCGRMGKYFRVIGRILAAEIRGCSDTY